VSEQIAKPLGTQRPLPGEQSEYGSIAVGVQFAGPLPPPGILQGYEAACTGAAHRIIELAESQSAHRRRLEEKELDAQVEGMRLQFYEARRGQVFAFCVSTLFLLCGAAVVIYGHPWPGSLFGTMGISGIVSTFIRGRSGKPEPQRQPPTTPQGSSKRKRNR
jgi:uncharacterized membrane protein